MVLTGRFSRSLQLSPWKYRLYVLREKHLTAIRSAGADEKLLLTPPIIMTLEEAIEYITDDDLIEITPKSIRLRKKILNTELRMKEMMRKRRAMEQGK